MEVYCKDCRYFRIHTGELASLSDSCEAPEFGMTKDYIYGDYKIQKYVGDDDYPNKRDSSGCEFYKEKVKEISWWKKL